MSLTEEQGMLSDMADRFLRERYGFSQRQAILAGREGCDGDVWRAFAEMGWLGLPFSSDLGGSDGTMVDVALLMRSFGAALVVEPYLPTVVLGGTALMLGATAQQKADLVPRICQGNLTIALGFAEMGQGYDHANPATRAERDAKGFRLTGDKAVVIGAPQAQMLIVSARTGGMRDGSVSLFLVPTDAEGLTIRAYATIDGRQAGDVSLRDVRLSEGSLLGALGGGGPILDRTIAAGTVAVLGEISGVVEAAVAITADYLNTREQFGRKLASFQALRHRVARIHVLKEEIKALCEQAAAAFALDPASPETTEAISAAKHYAGVHGRRICEEAVQLHGAIAITDEYIAGHFLKRMVVLDHMFGNAHHHMALFAERARSLAPADAPASLEGAA